MCGTSAALADELCPWCRLFVEFSDKIQHRSVLVVSRQPSAADDCTLPALDGGSEYLSLTDQFSARKRLASGEPVARVYTKNAPFTGLTYSTNLYVGDYAASNSMEELAEQIKGEKPEVTTEEIRELQTTYEDMLKAILWVLDGAKYLWQGSTNREEKSPDSGNC